MSLLLNRVYCLILISTLFQKAKKTVKKGLGGQTAAQESGRGNLGGGRGGRGYHRAAMLP
jgi:hypothetical protein